MKAAAYEIMGELEDSHWWYRARRTIVSGVVTRFVPPRSEIVDFGAGTGGTADCLREFGYKMLAADVSEKALEGCRLRGLPTLDLREKPLKEHSADCVLAGDVLEHVNDDVALLLAFRRALRPPRGVVVITVPAFQFLWSGEDYISEHVRRYTRRTLQQRLDAAGFRTLWCSYFNTLLFPVIASVRVTKRLLFPRAMYRSDVVPLGHWQNECLAGLFALEGRLLRRITFPMGVSLLAVARPVASESGIH
jgi:SAM-dependent methyltransferase